MKYLIFGPGRAGANMASYLLGLGHQAVTVSRQEATDARERCEKLITDADTVIAAIPDGKIEAWLKAWSGVIRNKPIIHLSGAVTLQGAYGFHPLYSFPPTIVAPEEMKQITFACPEEGPAFEDIFPGAPNPNFKISDDDRAHYHALAVLSGNLASYLWNETAKEFADRYKTAPRDALKVYFDSILHRFEENPTASMTGPIARRDPDTVKANLDALENAPQLESLYQAFLRSAWPEYANK